ncbi:MAG: PilZ domain-containing protein [Methylococcales bacterium]|jgi:hypothetical protein|nr:PilZ domain-containing protein [Methylococcales bacterium]MBT7445963.1 PilZ domain-containing protein [Methylococcales bacterium]
MKKHDEKRDYIRMTAECEVSFTDPESSLRHHGLSKNLSGKGILFETSKAVEAGTLVELTVSPENTSTPPLHALVEIVRSTPTADPTIFSVAASIKEILP